MTIQHVVEGAAAPSAAPPSVGAHYVNTANGDQYLAKGTESAADWVLQAPGMSKAEADETYQPKGSYATTQQLSEKVSTEAGKGLSTNDYTNAEKAKLAGLESSHYKGSYLSLAALAAALPQGAPGDYADVDGGAGQPVTRHVWDPTDSKWEPQRGASAEMTAAQVKALYESNADTNPFTDAERDKLAGLQPGDGGGDGGGGDDTIVETETEASFSYTNFFGAPSTAPSRTGQKCVQIDINGNVCEWTAAYYDWMGGFMWRKSLLPLAYSGLGVPQISDFTIEAHHGSLILNKDKADAQIGTRVLLPPTEVGQYPEEKVFPKESISIVLLNWSNQAWRLTLDPSLSWTAGAEVDVEAYGLEKLGITHSFTGAESNMLTLEVPADKRVWFEVSLWVGTDGSYIAYEVIANEIHPMQFRA